jgi:transposase-like protein
MIQKNTKKERCSMPRSTYTAPFKTKIVLEVLREEKELGEIAAEHNLNPNMVRNWKREFLENAETVFENPKKLEREAKRKEAALEKKNNQMLKTIGQLTLERDFLQDCFRRTGQEIPRFDSEEA